MTMPDPPPWEEQPRSDEPMEVDDSTRRITWGATAVIILALAVAALLFVLQIWWAFAVSLVVAAAAAGVAWRAGVLRDVKH